MVGSVTGCGLVGTKCGEFDLLDPNRYSSLISSANEQLLGQLRATSGVDGKNHAKVHQDGSPAATAQFDCNALPLMDVSLVRGIEVQTTL